MKIIDKLNIKFDFFWIGYGDNSPINRDKYKEFTLKNNQIMVNWLGKEKILKDDNIVTQIKEVIINNKEKIYDFSERQKSKSGKFSVGQLLIGITDECNGRIGSLRFSICNRFKNKELNEFYEKFKKELFDIIEKNEIFNIDEDAKRFTLKQLIKENAGPDPFWEECINDFFNKINKTEDEKIDFFKKLSLNQHLFNDFTKEIVKPLDVKQIFEKYNRLLNNNERVVEENPDIKLKKIVEEVIGNNDPYWNEPVYTVVKKIIKLPNESEITIAKLLNYDPKEAFVEPLTQGQVSNLIMEVCKKINIGLEEISDEFIGLAYNVQYKKVKLNLERELLGDIELKKIVEEVIGNNDPYWNEPVYTVVKKIIDLPDGTETTIIKLLNNSQYTSKQLFEIYNSVLNVCNKIDIILDSSKLKGRITGLPYSIPFIIKHN